MRTLLIVCVMLMLTTPAMAADSIRDTYAPNTFVYKDVDSLIEGVRITMSWKEGMSKEDWRLLMAPLLACIPPNDTPVVHNTEKDAQIAPFSKTFTAVHVTVIAGDMVGCRGYVPDIYFIHKSD